MTQRAELQDGIHGEPAIPATRMLIAIIITRRPGASVLLSRRSTQINADKNLKSHYENKEPAPESERMLGQEGTGELFA